MKNNTKVFLALGAGIFLLSGLKASRMDECFQDTRGTFTCLGNVEEILGTEASISGTLLDIFNKENDIIATLGETDDTQIIDTSALTTETDVGAIDEPAITLLKTILKVVLGI